jgi:hypothetical protein
MTDFGVSFSVKQCRNFGIRPTDCLKWLIKDAGFKRFRLMSYWDEIEKSPGKFDFTELDKQVKYITEQNGQITLCLGARQPRWPENHWPNWAWELPKYDRTLALLHFLEIVVRRYRTYPCIVSYQLENEALLKEFGERSDVDRARLRAEYKMVKRLDPFRPIVMTTSTSWGIPVRRPRPDIVGFSFYQVFFSAKKQKYSTSFHTPLLHRVRAAIIALLWQRPSFIHELQLEPWGPQNIWEMEWDEQMKSMSPEQIERNLQLAKKTGLEIIDLWGGEWWYWCYKNGHLEIPKTVTGNTTS